MKLQVGNRIRDNDPRMGNRVLRVERITEAGPFGGHRWAVCRRTVGNDAREHRIRLDRIKSDGKPRRGGFTLLQRPGGLDGATQ